MSAERRRSRLGMWGEVMNVEDDYKRRAKNVISKTQSQGHGCKLITLESVVLLACLTVSLVILPLVLPPLPPPPFLLLLLPILILGLLMLLAFMPRHAHTNATYT